MESFFGSASLIGFGHQLGRSRILEPHDSLVSKQLQIARNWRACSAELNELLHCEDALPDKPICFQCLARVYEARSKIVDQETEAYKQLAKLKSRDGKPLAQSTTPRASSTPSLVSQRGPCISAEIVRRLLELEEEAKQLEVDLEARKGVLSHAEETGRKLREQEEAFSTLQLKPPLQGTVALPSTASSTESEEPKFYGFPLGCCPEIEEGFVWEDFDFAWLLFAHAVQRLLNTLPSLSITLNCSFGDSFVAVRDADDEIPLRCTMEILLEPITRRRLEIAAGHIVVVLQRVRDRLNSPAQRDLRLLRPLRMPTFKDGWKTWNAGVHDALHALEGLLSCVTPAL